MSKRYIKSTGEKDVDELLARFNYAYLAMFPNVERMERIQKTYGNQVSTLVWPTIANCSIPLTFMAIEEMLPAAMKYLFPRNRFVNLIPSRGLDRTVVKRVEENLRYTMRTQMKSELACFPSIKDNYKFAVGYGLVDTELITPPEERIMQAEEGGRVVGRIPQLEIGAEIQIPAYIYIPPICVIPMPGGANVEGPNRAPGHFVIVFKSESQFRSMYKQKGLDGKPILKGDMEEIIKEARALNFDYRMPTPDMIATLANLQITKTNNGDKKMPVLIPIVRWYEDHHQMWIANGRHKIYEVKEKYQTLRSDLIKWSAWPDGNDWFPLGVTEASENVALGTNIWYNGLIDLAMYHINPVRLINTRIVENHSNLSRSPRSDIKINGIPEQAVGYLKLPEFPSQLFSMGEILQRFHANSNGITNGAQERSPGMVRGGANALENFLQSTTTRQYLAAIMIKSGGLEPMIEKTLMLKQLIMGEEGEIFVEPAYDKVTGEVHYDEKTVTLDDIRHVYRIELDMPVARLNEMASFTQRCSVFDRATKMSELFDQRALFEYIEEDEMAIRRIMLPEDVVKERQDRMAEARMKNVEAGVEPEGNAGAPPTEGEEALAGQQSLLPQMIGG